MCHHNRGSEVAPLRLILTLFVAATSSAPDAAAQMAPRPGPPLYTIGCGGCTGPELFSTVNGLAVRADGGVVVADATSPFVRAFHSDGSPHYTALTRGEGPGEGMNVVALASLDGGRTVVLDSRLRRVTLLEGDGRVIETVVPPDFPLGLYGSRDSGFWTIETDFRAAATFRRWGDDGESSSELGLDLTDIMPSDANLAFHFFAAAAGPDGRLAVGEGETWYRIRVFDRSGQVLHNVSRELERLPKSQEEMDAERESRTAARNRLAGVVSSRGGTNPEASALSAGIEVDPLKRHFYINDLEIDDQNRLWVRTPRGDRETTVFDVFSDAGAYLGEVTLPGLIRRFSVGGGYLAAVLLDELDVATIQVWRIEG